MPLELVAVSRRYGKELALDRLDLCVREGDCYGLIGHNGAGKTTAMRIALGLQRANSGLVLVDGLDAARFPREARGLMGGLIEVPGFYGRWSAVRNLACLARLQGFTRDGARRQALRQIERVGLAHAAERDVQGFSHGMRQRLGIAQALLGDPRYLVLDEPTNGLDPEGIAEVRALIDDIVRSGDRSVLISSHQLHEIATVCNRIGVVRRGKLLVEEETSALLAAGSRRYRIDTADRELATRVFQTLSIHELDAHDGAQWIDLGTRNATDVARELVGAGVGLNAFAPSPPTLEEIYLRFARESTDEAVVHARSTSAVQASKPTAGARAAPGRSRLSPTWRMLRFESFRLIARFALPILLATPALLAFAAVAHRASQARADAQSIAKAELFSATSVNAFEGAGVALQAGLPWLALLALGLASQSIAGDFARGTLRNILLRPLRRGEVAAGKWSATALAVLAAYAVLAGAALCAASAFFDFGDVVEVLPNGSRFTLVPAAELWPVLARALGSPLLPLCAYTALGFLAGAIARTGAGALALALGLGVAFDLARAPLRAFGAEGFLPSAYLPSPLGDGSFIGYFVDASRGISDARFDHASTALVVPAAWLLLCFALAARILARRPVP